MKVWYLLSPQEQRRGILLLFMMIVMAFLDTIGVASILPFMAVLTNPELIETNIILNNIYQATMVFGVKNKFEFLFVLGISVFFILVSSLAFKGLTIFAQERFINMREYSMGKRLIEGYIHQPYSWFLNRNSADLGKKYFIRGK
jgi:ABC-type multidrug transport system fused ATPase/permease subunit